jgi:hypothetical protein
MLSRDVTKIGAHLGRNQVQYALAILRNESIQENQSLYSSGVSLYHPPDDKFACMGRKTVRMLAGPWITFGLRQRKSLINKAQLVRPLLLIANFKGHSLLNLRSYGRAF